MRKLSLVTVLYNSDDVLEGFLRSISMQSYKNYHLYIIDNSVNDATNVLLKQLLVKYPVSSYTHIENSKNLGVAAANNQGIKASITAEALYTILLNNDIEFTQTDLFENIIDQADQNHEEFIVPKIFYYDSEKIWVAGGKINRYTGTTIHRGDNKSDSFKYNTPGYFTYAPTCFVLIANRVFNVIGVMDEKYFVYYDDADFMYRAVKYGYKIYYMPSLNVSHRVSSSTGGAESLFTIYYGNRNRIYFILKNFPHVNQIIAITYTIVTRLLKYIKYNSTQRNKMTTSILDGFKMYASK